MYFTSRVEAGRKLAGDLLPKYRYENCAVVALDDGGVMVGTQIASQLHTVITMLLSEQINLPREIMAIGGLTNDGTFTYNRDIPEFELNDIIGDYYTYIEQEKLQKMHHMNQMLGSGGMMDKNLLRGHVVILVSDGIMDGFQIDLAAAFLKPIRMERLIIATPVASVSAVDRMHILADEIICPTVVEGDFPKDHYYDVQDIPDHETIVKTIEEIIYNWK